MAPPSSSSAPGATTPNNGLVTIESDRQQGDNQTGVVTATGNVKITYPDRGMVATSRQAQYFTKEGRLVLSGDVDVIDHQGQRIRAERLVYNLDQERLLAQPAPGQQVKSRLRLSMPLNNSSPGARNQ
jgi:lipopolysaccharide export system protein LptA